MTPEETLDALWAMLNRPEGDQQALKLLADIRAQARAEALEEAARVADDKRPDDGDPINLGYNIACEDIAAAIRALKDGEPKP